MNLSDYDLLSKEEKEEINNFIIDNIETVYDRREAYGTKINLQDKHLSVLDDKTIKNEFVESVFVGYWCNQCNMYIDPRSDIGLIMHVLKHIRGEPLDDEDENEEIDKFRNEILDYARAVDELHTHTSVGDE